MQTNANTKMPRVAVIGAGYWGKNLVRNFHALGALEVICDSDVEHLKALSAQYAGVRTMTTFNDVLNDKGVTCVAISTPAETHAALVRAALLSGKDVFVEKPLALNIEDGEALVALARQSGRILMVGHLLWYHPAITKLQELIRTGELGKIQYIYSNRLSLGKIRREENILWSFAPHDISVIIGLLGEMPESVFAQGGNYLNHHIADVTVSLLSFKSGVKAHIYVSWLHPFKEQKLVIVGDRKMAVFNDVEKSDKLTLYAHSIDWKNQVPVVNKAEGQVVALAESEPLRAECAHFLDCVANRKKPLTDGEEGLRVLRVLQQCQQALTQTPNVCEKASMAQARSYFAHETAIVDENVEIGEKTKIWHFSHILSGSRLGSGVSVGQNVVIGPRVTVGNGVKIQNNVSVYEGVTLEDDVFCGPSMVFTNVYNPRSAISRMHELKRTHVGRGATIGANSTVVCGHDIGAFAFIGAGAVVTKYVPAFALVVGNPARRIGWMCGCGTRLPKDLKCMACGEVYRQVSEEKIEVKNENSIYRS